MKVIKNKTVLMIITFIFVATFAYLSPMGNAFTKPKLIEAQTTSNALEGEFHLDNIVKIYIPSTNGSDPISTDEHNKWVDNAMSHFSIMFGGATSVDGNGAWVDDKGNLIKEKVTIVYSFAQKLNNSKIDDVANYAKQIKEELHQSTVSVEVNGKMYFVE